MVYRKVGEIWTSDFCDMLAERTTYRQTDMLITILCTPSRVDVVTRLMTTILFWVQMRYISKLKFHEAWFVVRILAVSDDRTQFLNVALCVITVYFMLRLTVASSAGRCTFRSTEWFSRETICLDVKPSNSRQSVCLHWNTHMLSFSF